MNRLLKPKANLVYGLEMTRSIAILSVLFFHIYHLLDLQSTNVILDFIAARLDVGVKLFFSLSGFVLTMVILESQKSYKNYLLARLIRLEVPYLVIVLAFYVIYAFVLGNSDVRLFNVFTTIIYCHTLVFGEGISYNPVFWSLEVEFWFYLLAPFYVRYVMDTKLFWIKIVAISFISICIRSYALNSHYGWLSLNFVSFISYFNIGIILYKFRHRISLILNKFPQKLLAITMGTVLVLLFYKPQSVIYTSFVLHIGLFVFLASLYVVNGDTKYSLLHRAIAAWSYSIYLTHLPTIHFLKMNMVLIPGNMWATFVVYFLISLVVGLVFFVFVERPFLGLREKLR